MAYVPNQPASAPIADGVVLEFPNNNLDAARKFLDDNHWPKGLQETFFKNLQKIPIRFFICDDSGSMALEDGHRLVTRPGNRLPKFVSCTRWSELTNALIFHATIAKLANAPSQFRFLNNSQPTVIGDNQDPDDSKYQRLMSILKDSSPNGGTPLCHHIKEVVASIQGIADNLRANNQKACVVIATDGESSDGDIAAALRPLQSLPVWVVIRLCTDEDKIVNYWNNIDSVLELDMDVLDDLEGEAEEIQENNRWLTYTEPLHRMREFGIVVKEMDLLDEASLSADQIRYFCAML